MTDLPPPVYTNPNAKASEQKYRQKYEKESGRILLPAQPETLNTNQIAYAATIVEQQIQSTGEQTLVNFAQRQNLDQIGAFWGVPRLPAARAKTRLRFVLVAAQRRNVKIPKNTQVLTEDEQFTFSTDEELIIPNGNKLGFVGATCTVPGEAGNGYPANTNFILLQPIQFLQEVNNWDTTNNGADVEADSRYRERIKLAPTLLSSAGSVGAYEQLVKSIDGAITAVSIKYWNFLVRIWFLTNTGLPSTQLLQKIRAELNKTSRRPLGDEIQVEAPTNIQVYLRAAFVIFPEVSRRKIRRELDNLFAKYKAELEQQLGKDLVPSYIVKKLHITGVYSVTLTRLNTDGTDGAKTIKIQENERAILNPPTFTIKALNE